MRIAQRVWDKKGEEQLGREGECGNVTSPFVILGVTVFDVSWGEGQEPSQ